MSARLAALVAGAVFVLLAASPAMADHLEVDATVPDTVTPGDIVELAVTVRSVADGQPQPGATVSLFLQATIVGVTGQVEVASARTDGDGVAVLRWQARGRTSDSVIIAYSQVGDVTVESEPFPVLTIGRGPQIVRSESGIKIPGLGAWILIGIIVGVWGLIQFAMLGPVSVAAHRGDDEPEPEVEP